MTDRDELTLTLRLACQRIARRIRFESTLEVSPGAYSVLVALEKQGDSSPRALAEVERVSAPSMTRTIACLAEDGLVTRAEDPADGRRAVIALTDSGRDLLTRTRRERNSWMARHLEDLTDAELEVLDRAAPLLRRIADS